ncbi:MAG: hypothetical protein EWM73_03479 [Nitrospira sp.]|nr:MAG: hypothetical protein EWM73_03479 [Nitrospira sp.]
MTAQEGETGRVRSEGNGTKTVRCQSPSKPYRVSMSCRQLYRKLSRDQPGANAFR